MATSGNSPGIEIIVNIPDVQAVKHSKLGICQTAFYKAGEINISEGLKV